MTQTNAPDTSLSTTQCGIVSIASFTASGDLEKLKLMLGEGLDAGLTVNEVKEILVQLYAYAGFPRSLNAINTLMAVIEERKSKGIVDKIGKEASPLPANINKDEYGAKVRASLAGQDVIPSPSGYQLFAPVIDTFLKEHLFADIFARDVLTHQQRELATIAALAVIPGAEAQLRFHLKAAMNTGLTKGQLHDFVKVLTTKVGQDIADRAKHSLTAVTKN